MKVLKLIILLLIVIFSSFGIIFSSQITLQNSNYCFEPEIGKHGGEDIDNVIKWLKELEKGVGGTLYDLGDILFSTISSIDGVFKGCPGNQHFYSDYDMCISVENPINQKQIFSEKHQKATQSSSYSNILSSPQIYEDLKGIYDKNPSYFDLPGTYKVRSSFITGWNQAAEERFCRDGPHVKCWWSGWKPKCKVYFRDRYYYGYKPTYEEKLATIEIRGMVDVLDKTQIPKSWIDNRNSLSVTCSDLNNKDNTILPYLPDFHYGCLIKNWDLEENNTIITGFKKKTYLDTEQIDIDSEFSQIFRELDNLKNKDLNLIKDTIGTSEWTDLEGNRVDFDNTLEKYIDEYTNIKNDLIGFKNSYTSLDKSSINMEVNGASIRVILQENNFLQNLNIEITNINDILNKFNNIKRQSNYATKHNMLKYIQEVNREKYREIEKNFPYYYEEGGDGTEYAPAELFEDYKILLDKEHYFYENIYEGYKEGINETNTFTHADLDKFYTEVLNFGNIINSSTTSDLDEDSVIRNLESFLEEIIYNPELTDIENSFKNVEDVINSHNASSIELSKMSDMAEKREKFDSMIQGFNFLSIKNFFDKFDKREQIICKEGSDPNNCIYEVQKVYSKESELYSIPNIFKSSLFQSKSSQFKSFFQDHYLTRDMVYKCGSTLGLRNCGIDGKYLAPEEVNNVNFNTYNILTKYPIEYYKKSFKLDGVQYSFEYDDISTFFIIKDFDYVDLFQKNDNNYNLKEIEPNKINGLKDSTYAHFSINNPNENLNTFLKNDKDNENIYEVDYNINSLLGPVNLEEQDCEDMTNHLNENDVYNVNCEKNRIVLKNEIYDIEQMNGTFFDNMMDIVTNLLHR